MTAKLGHSRFGDAGMVNPVAPRRATAKEKSHHMPGTGNGKTLVTDLEVWDIRRRRHQGEKSRVVARDYLDMSVHSFRNIWYGITKAHISGLEPPGSFDETTSV